MAETSYPLNRTGLIVVDATNDFISEGGKLWGAVEDVVTQVGGVPNTGRAWCAARAARHPGPARPEGHAAVGLRPLDQLTLEPQRSARTPDLRVRFLGRGV